MVGDKVPYEFLKDLMKNKASLENIKVSWCSITKWIVHGEEYDKTEFRRWTNVWKGWPIGVSKQTNFKHLWRCHKSRYWCFTQA